MRHTRTVTVTSLNALTPHCVIMGIQEDDGEELRVRSATLYPSPAEVKGVSIGDRVRFGWEPENAPAELVLEPINADTNPAGSGPPFSGYDVDFLIRDNARLRKIIGVLSPVSVILTLAFTALLLAWLGR